MIDWKAEVKLITRPFNIDFFFLQHGKFLHFHGIFHLIDWNAEVKLITAIQY